MRLRNDNCSFPWRQLLSPVVGVIRFQSSLLVCGLLGAVAGAGQLQDDRVVYEAIDGGRSGHGVIEDLIPLGEDERSLVIMTLRHVEDFSPPLRFGQLVSSARFTSS